jgi:hypothetical protein
MRRIAPAAASIAALWACAAAQAAAPLQISGPTPFGHGCGTTGSPTFNSSAEPSIAVDPRDARHIVVTWQQDRFNSDGGANSNVVAVSHDGGHSFREVTVGGLSRCTGGSDERASDPWVTIGPDGAVYLASLTFSEMPQNQLIAGPTELAVSRSDDGGLTWRAPVYVAPFDETYNDREQLIADPHHPGVVYFAWVKRYAVEGESGIEMFSRSVDGGRTWSPASVAYAPPPGMLTDPALLVVTPDGTLVNLIMIANLSPFLPSPSPRIDWTVIAQRSTDMGRTWSHVSTIATVDPFPPIEPSSGKIVRAYPLISTDVGPDGSVYVAWNDIPTPTGGSRVLISKSSDDALSWSPAGIVASSTGQMFLPSVAVDRTGAVGVTYDDTRNSTAGHLTTDVWLSRSSDGGSHWAERHVSGPFETLTASESDSSGVQGLFLGDYQGLAGLPSGFAAAFAQARPLATHGPSDMYFAALTGSDSTAPAARAGARLTLTVNPTGARVGRRTRFAFYVAAGAPPVAGAQPVAAPIAGARILFEGRRLRSNAKGRATVVLTPRHAGLRRALALAPGQGSATAYVRVRGRRSARRVLQLQTR